MPACSTQMIGLGTVEFLIGSPPTVTSIRSEANLQVMTAEDANHRELTIRLT